MPARVRIDREHCLGSGRCLDELPAVFATDADGLSHVRAGAPSTPIERLLEAARACPGGAIAVLDAAGREIDLD